MILMMNGDAPRPATFAISCSHWGLFGTCHGDTGSFDGVPNMCAYYGIEYHDISEDAWAYEDQQEQQRHNEWLVRAAAEILDDEDDHDAECTGDGEPWRNIP